MRGGEEEGWEGFVLDADLQPEGEEEDMHVLQSDAGAGGRGRGWGSPGGGEGGGVAWAGERRQLGGADQGLQLGGQQRPAARGTCDASRQSMTHPPRPTPPSLSERDPAEGSREAVLVAHGNPAGNCDGGCEPWIKTVDEAAAEDEAAGFTPAL